MGAADGSRTQGRHIPALRFHRLTPLLDPLFKAVMREHTLKTALIRHARIGPGMRVLDPGCGTGTLTIRAQRSRALSGWEVVMAARRSHPCGIVLRGEFYQAEGRDEVTLRPGDAFLEPLHSDDPPGGPAAC